MTLVLAATPIGRSDDASPRLCRELAEADTVAAEDTRRLRALLSRLEITMSGTLVSYFEGNEAERTQQLVDELIAGRRVVLVTDAGMPSVSDPGYRLVAAAVEAGIDVTVVPGPSAVLAALAVSGLPADRFCFEGFLPRKAGERSRRLAELATESRTLVCFESPHRLGATLVAMAASFGSDRQAAVCRELTKTYEEVVRGSLRELVDWAREGVRGEITLVVAGASREGLGETRSPEQLRVLVDEAVASGASRRDAIAQVVATTGAPRRAVYDAAHAARNAVDPPP